MKGNLRLGGTYYLGIDVGSVSTNFALLDGHLELCEKLCLDTGGQPIAAVIRGLNLLAGRTEEGINVAAAGTTGSGRQLAGLIAGADVIKNEITAHAAAACRFMPGVRTVIEIGGQDSKIILLKDGMVTDFAMNTVCAAGTGSFLDRQAMRLGIPIEQFGGYALRSKSPVRIAGRCAVFAESDMIHKQQTGHANEDIIAGLCRALVRNYLNNLAKGKELCEPILFQGGVAANVGIVAAFEQELQKSVVVPPHHEVMGAYGAALLAGEAVQSAGKTTAFKGMRPISGAVTVQSLECGDCPNRCEVVSISANGEPMGHWGDRCGKWSSNARGGQTANKNG